jgi:hypothetical protein
MFTQYVVMGEWLTITMFVMMRIFHYIEPALTVWQELGGAPGCLQVSHHALGSGGHERASYSWRGG